MKRVNSQRFTLPPFAQVHVPTCFDSSPQLLQFHLYRGNQSLKYRRLYAGIETNVLRCAKGRKWTHTGIVEVTLKITVSVLQLLAWVHQYDRVDFYTIKYYASF